jgi:hypothetical protein
VDPKVLRQHARDCGRLAEECADLFTREALRDLAMEFWRAAGALEAERRRSADSRQRGPSLRTSRKPAHRVAPTHRRASR